MTLLWIEFLGLFVGAPIAVALLLPPSQMFPALLALTVVGLILLHLTPGFQWRRLWDGTVSWRILGIFAGITFAGGVAVMLWRAPGQLFLLVEEQPWLMLSIALLYPPVSALPQELLFRPLFFRRYAALLPRPHNLRIALNAAIFSLAHLMYWSWVVAAMTFVGGLVFAWAYLRSGGFVMALVLHSVAGVILFAVGLGIYFYSGNVIRPF